MMRMRSQQNQNSTQPNPKIPCYTGLAQQWYQYDPRNRRTLWRLWTNVGNAAVWHIPIRCELHGATRQTSERQTTYQRDMFASSIESE
eukprot:scaffold581142_cov59-Attheya_sp.AAC.1